MSPQAGSSSLPNNVEEEEGGGGGLTQEFETSKKKRQQRSEPVHKGQPSSPSTPGSLLAQVRPQSSLMKPIEDMANPNFFRIDVDEARYLQLFSTLSTTLHKLRRTGIIKRLHLFLPYRIEVQCSGIDHFIA